MTAVSSARSPSVGKGKDAGKPTTHIRAREMMGEGEEVFYEDDMVRIASERIKIETLLRAAADTGLAPRGKKTSPPPGSPSGRAAVKPDGIETGTIDEAEPTCLEASERYVIDPSSLRKFQWDLLVILFVIYNAVMIPVYPCFRVPQSPQLAALDYVIDAFFWVDIIVSFRTGFYDGDGEIVNDARQIAYQYMTGWFIIDFSSTFPFELVVPSDAAQAVGFIKCIRLFRLGRLFKMLNKQSAGQANFFSILRILMMLLMACHWIGCLWMLVQQSLEGNPDRWLDNGIGIPVANRSLGEVYPHVLYTAMLMTSGDSTSIQTQTEAWFCCITTLVGMTMLAVLVSNMAVLMANMNAQERNFREAVGAMTDEMRILRVPQALRDRVLDYYEYLFEHQPNLIQGQTWMTQFPRYIQIELMNHLHIKTLQEAACFNDCTPGFLAEVVLRLKQQVFMKKEFVFRQGDFGDSMFFINSGSVLIYLKPPDGLDGSSTPLQPLVTLEVGKAFGELAIFFRQPRAAGAVASTCVTAMSLDKRDINDICPNFPIDQQVLAKNLQNMPGMKDKFRVYWSAGSRCFQKEPVSSPLALTGAPLESPGRLPPLEGKREGGDGEMAAFKEETLRNLSSLNQRQDEVAEALGKILKHLQIA